MANQFKKYEKIIILILTIWLSVFLFLLQSLTGIGILIICGYVFIFLQLKSNKTKAIRLSGYFLLVIIPIAVVTYVVFFVKDYRNFDVVDNSSLEMKTMSGNIYTHDFNNQQVENRHWVGLYLCDKELRNEWNKVSDYKYDELDLKGQKIKYTLIRYLTSKGFKKDAEGVKSLSDKDIKEIETGIANYIFSERNGLYNRLYQVVWELDLYMRGGNAAGHSVSQRFEYLRIGALIIKEHPFFGVGTGDVQNEYDKKYEELNSIINDIYRHRAHNQFVTFTIALGLIGLIIILIAIFYPPYYEKRYSDYLFMFFMLIAIVSMFNEDTLETQPGVTFFALFYSLHIFGRQKL